MVTNAFCKLVYQETYDKKIWSMLTTRSHPKVYNTKLHGRLHVGDAIQGIRELRLQAEFCVSNKAVTKAVVSSVFGKSIPANS